MTSRIDPIGIQQDSFVAPNSSAQVSPLVLFDNKLLDINCDIVSLPLLLPDDLEALSHIANHQGLLKELTVAISEAALQAHRVRLQSCRVHRRRWTAGQQNCRLALLTSVETLSVEPSGEGWPEGFLSVEGAVRESSGLSVSGLELELASNSRLASAGLIELRPVPSRCSDVWTSRGNELLLSSFRPEALPVRPRNRRMVACCTSWDLSATDSRRIY